MNDAAIPLCLSCSEPMATHGHTGRRRLYCSDRCRQRASRARRRPARILPGPPEPAPWEPVASAPVAWEPPEPSDPAPAPARIHAGTDEDVARAILEARGLAGSFAILGQSARSRFSWRCEEMGAAILEALEDLFPTA